MSTRGMSLWRSARAGRRAKMCAKKIFSSFIAAGHNTFQRSEFHLHMADLSIIGYQDDDDAPYCMPHAQVGRPHPVDSPRAAPMTVVEASSAQQLISAAHSPVFADRFVALHA